MIRFFTAERRKGAGHWLAELGIVVAGVLIALYAQQWDSERQAKKRGAESKERIREEMFANSWLQMERLAIHNCQRDRLATIMTKIARGDDDWNDFAYPLDSGGLWTIKRIYRPVSRNYNKDAFEGAVASGSLDMMEPERRVALGGTYRQYAKAEAIQQEEYALAARLDSLTVGGPIPPSEKRQLFDTIALLDRYNGLSTLIAKQGLASLKDLGMLPTSSQLREWKESSAEDDSQMGLINVARERAVYGDCVDPSGFDFEKTSSDAKIH